MTKFINTLTEKELPEGSYRTLCKRAWDMAQKGQLTTFNADPHFAFRCNDANMALAVSWNIEADSVDMYADPKEGMIWGYAFEGSTEEWLPVVKVIAA